jgi:hypothetical protein
MSDPWKHPLPWRVIRKAIAPGLRVPARGWTAQEFAAQGRLLLIAMVRLSRITAKKAEPYIRQTAGRIFERQLEEIIRRAETRAGVRSIKAEERVEIIIAGHEALWARALEEVLAEQGAAVVAELVPPIQSVMGQGYNRVSALMGQEVTHAGNQRIAHRALQVAQRIVRVNDTTRHLIERQVRQSIKDGLTVTETAARLRETVPAMQRARVNTIARTETQNAFTEGAVTSFQESETLTHVSVIGCESREKDRWDSPSYQQFMYRGESTCNIQDVPAMDADKLKFHPNHTGTLVPSRFRNEDGSVSPIV